MDARFGQPPRQRGVVIGTGRPSSWQPIELHSAIRATGSVGYIRGSTLMLVGGGDRIDKTVDCRDKEQIKWFCLICYTHIRALFADAR